jgi:hypothetical protein
MREENRWSKLETRLWKARVMLQAARPFHLMLEYYSSRKKSLREIFNIDLERNISCPTMNLGWLSNQVRQRLLVRILFLRLSRMQ